MLLLSSKPNALLTCCTTGRTQGRVGIIVRTLYHVGPPVAHLVVVLVVLGLMFSAMAHLVLGTYVGPLSTLSGAVSDTFTLFVGHSVVEDVDTIRPRDQLLAPAQVGAA